jgi:hypothetical protein
MSRGMGNFLSTFHDEKLNPDEKIKIFSDPTVGIK